LFGLHLQSLTDQFRRKDVQQRGEVTIRYEDFLSMVMSANM
jgi:hypothetical protein